MSSIERNGKLSQLKEDKLKAYRESDQLIVLGERESRLHGEGVDRNTKLAKEIPLSGTNLTANNSNKVEILNNVSADAETSIIEKPGAIILHAGICVGDVWQQAFLP